MKDQILHDTNMKLLDSNSMGDRYCTTLPYEFLDPYRLSEFWVDDPEDDIESEVMIEAKSDSMGPHFLKLTKADLLLFLLAAQEKGWFEDV